MLKIYKKNIFVKPKLILIVTVNTDIFTNPSIVYFIRRNLLMENNIVVISHTKQLFSPPEDLIDIKIFTQPLYMGRKLYSFFEVYKNLLFFNKYFKNADSIIAIDSDGLIQACKWKILTFSSSRLIYWSFEVVILKELVTISSRLKKMFEILCSKLINLIIVQDEERRKMLFLENKISKKLPTLLIPVSPIKFDKSYISNFSTTKILYSGSVENWTGIEDLLYSVDKYWTQTHLLHIHSRHKLNQEDTFVKKLLLLKKNGKLGLSDEYFENEDKYLEFISQFDIGIVIYKPIYFGGGLGKNISNIGLSSGKFSSYLACGKPVIVSSDPTYENLRKRYKFGEIYTDFNQIPLLITTILNNYQDYVNDAVKLFDIELNPEKKFEQLSFYDL
jgi:hypothetical protein